MAEYRKVMELHANSSNNTVYADADGHIAYFHPQFVPKRDDRFDWTRPVDGSDPATEWHGVHAVEDSPHVVDPPSGWIQNTNNWPYSAAGPYSPKRQDFPGVHGQRPARARGGCTRSGCWRGGRTSRSIGCGTRRSTAISRRSPELCRALLRRTTRAPDGDSLKASVAEPIAALRDWDYRWSAGSVPTSLAVYWGEALMALVVAGHARRGGLTIYDYMADAHDGGAEAGSARRRLSTGSRATSALGGRRGVRSIGSSGSPVTSCTRSTTAAPSIPVPFTSARWGSLASFGARTYPGTKKMYGTSGNSFVAVVEFGEDSVRARGCHGGRRERGSRSSALQRSGGAVCERAAPRRVLLSGAARGPYGT